MESETIAIIPARKGSKRVPGKNKLLFNGKSLVQNTIEQALESKIFKKIILSSDDDEILSQGKIYDVILLERKASLSGDDTTLLDVIKDAISHESIPSQSCIGLLLVTAPLRVTSDIKNAYDLYKNSSHKHSVVSVCSNINPIDLSWKMDGEYLQPAFPDSYKLNIPKHNRELTFFFNDACIFDSAKNFLSEGRNLFGERPIPYNMPQERSLFIDYNFQLELIHLLADNNNSKK